MEAPSPRSHSIRHSYSTGWDLATALASTGRLDERRAAAAVLIPLLQILSERHGKVRLHGDHHGARCCQPVTYYLANWVHVRRLLHQCPGTLLSFAPSHACTLAH